MSNIDDVIQFLTTLQNRICAELEALDLSSNQLIDLPQELLKLKRLNSLKFSGRSSAKLRQS